MAQETSVIDHMNQGLSSVCYRNVITPSRQLLALFGSWYAMLTGLLVGSTQQPGLDP